jgi:hypothetical protein
MQLHVLPGSCRHYYYKNNIVIIPTFTSFRLVNYSVTGFTTVTTLVINNYYYRLRHTYRYDMLKVILSLGSCFRCQFRSFSLFHRALGITGLSQLFSPFPYANDLEFRKLIWYNTGYPCCLQRKHSLYLDNYISYVCHRWVVHSNIINVISDQLSMFKGHKAETRWRYHALSYFIQCVTVCNSSKHFGLKKLSVIFTQSSNTIASLFPRIVCRKKRHLKRRNKTYEVLLKIFNEGTLWNCLMLSVKR